MAQLRYFVQKELLLLGRDLHGLLLLFVMPAVFILIMTFALQNQYASEGEVSIDYYLFNRDAGPQSQQLIEALDQIDSFQRIPSAANEQQLRASVAQDEGKFLIIIADGFEKKLTDEEVAIQLEIAPSTTPVFARLMESQLQSQLERIYLTQTLTPLLEDAGLKGTTPTDKLDHHNFIRSLSLYGDGQERPSSVQQNVPAWLLFAMFFIAIPLSTTLIGERQQGTLARLHTMGFPHYTMLLGKLIPYFLINLLQVVAMLLIGLYLVPTLGGEGLILGNNLGGLALVSICASLAAVAYALFVAQLANTTEQATIFSGVCNIIMAAIGGVMVPRYIMPPAMQDLSVLSPMAWGLDGFFDILLRNGTLGDVLTEAGTLLGFALAMLALSVLLTIRRGY